MLSGSIDPEIIKLFPSIKSGVVERGLWRIPLYFDKSFERNRGCIRLRRYIIHMAEIGETKEAMMDKTCEIYKEFLELIERYPADKEIVEKRKAQLDKYMQEFVNEISELIAKGDSTQFF
ncbi:MAG: hypothetical protein PHH85_02435 [Candidatus Methanoperedens sp.]|nr:hypothetical protein [Candidatus Methanoperedens sp.]